MQVVAGVIVGGKYQVEQPLARGGMGAVWVARHIKLGSAVAIKFLDAHLAAAPALVARFEREARAAANLETPHVVRVHDYGVEDGTPYLVMELLRGEDLNTRLRHRRRFSLVETGKILTQMGRALRRAHEVGIVHRDLKPANVFLASVDGDEVVKVLDFGIAKETWSRVEENTKTGEVFGSPHYMSPEQARAQKNVDQRADVWATGVIVYRMITGRLPFPGEVLGEVLSCVLVDPFPPLAEVAPELPPALEGFFARALAKKREERFSSIGEMVDAFTAIVAEPERSSYADGRASLATAATLEPPEFGPAPHRASPPEAPPRAATAVVPRPAPANVLVPPPAARDAQPFPSRGGDTVPTPGSGPLAGRSAHASGAEPVAQRPPAAPAAETNVPTQVYVRPSAQSQTTDPPPADTQTPVEKTGPSIASATNSLVPATARAPHWRAPALLFGAAVLVVLVVGGVLAAGSSGSSAPSSNPVEAALSSASVPGPTDSAPSAPFTPPVEPAPSASVVAGVPAATSVAPGGTEAPRGTAVTVRDKTGAPPPTARPKVPPTGTTTGKKPRDWGL